MPKLHLIAGVVSFVTLLAAISAPVRAERVCDPPVCHRECWPTQRGMCCRRRCQQRCWSRPDYVPPPRYVPSTPRYIAPPQSQAVPFTFPTVRIPPEFIGGAFMLFGVIGALWLIAHLAHLASLRRDPTSSSRSRGRDLLRRADALNQEIDDLIRTSREDAYRRGRSS